MYRKRFTPKPTRRRSARRYRLAVVVGSGVVGSGNYAVIDLLTPVQPAGTIADTIYQQMTNPTLARVSGHVDIYDAQQYTLGTSQNGGIIPFAWGLYVDKDIASTGTALPPYSLGFTTTWMMHRTGSVAAPGFLSDATRAAFTSVGYPQVRRYNINQTKYKRKLDSFNDTLVFAVENASTTIALSYDFYFKLLLLE